MKLLHSYETDYPGMYEQWWLRPDGKITIRRVQDAEPILDENARRRNHTSHKSRRDYGEGLGVKAASIPYGLIEEIKMKTGINLMTCSDQQLKQILNSSEYAKLRTSHGRI